MNVYSVYDYNTRRYSYYQGSGPGGTHAGAPPISGLVSRAGATVDQAAWKLPMDAKKIGEGDLPKGRIASRGGSISLSDFGGGDAAKLGMLGLAAYLAWRYLR